MSDYKIGDCVIATRDIWQAADDYGPEAMYAAKGDLLIVRSIGMTYPVNVSHEGLTNSSFGVRLDEIRRCPVE